MHMFGFMMWNLVLWIWIMLWLGQTLFAVLLLELKIEDCHGIYGRFSVNEFILVWILSWATSLWWLLLLGLSYQAWMDWIGFAFCVESFKLHHTSIKGSKSVCIAGSHKDIWTLGWFYVFSPMVWITSPFKEYEPKYCKWVRRVGSGYPNDKWVGYGWPVYGSGHIRPDPPICHP